MGIYDLLPLKDGHDPAFLSATAGLLSMARFSATTTSGKPGKPAPPQPSLVCVIPTAPPPILQPGFLYLGLPVPLHPLWHEGPHPAQAVVPTGVGTPHRAGEHRGRRSDSCPGTPLGHHPAFPDRPHLPGPGVSPLPHLHPTPPQPWPHLGPLGTEQQSLAFYRFMFSSHHGHQRNVLCGSQDQDGGSDLAGAQGRGGTDSPVLTLTPSCHFPCSLHNLLVEAADRAPRALQTKIGFSCVPCLFPYLDPKAC